VQYDEAKPKESMQQRQIKAAKAKRRSSLSSPDEKDAMRLTLTLTLTLIGGLVSQRRRMSCGSKDSELNLMALVQHRQGGGGGS